MKKAITQTVFWTAIFLAQLLPTNSSFSQCVNTFPYNEGFETAPSWTAGGTNSDWAWGTPAHPTINTAGGGVRSWCVGGLTGSFYALSLQSTLTSPCFNLSTLNYPWISFKIFWEVERQWDGMQLQYSTNGGATWTRLGSFGDPVDCNTDNWYNYNNITWLNSLPAGTRHGWSGRVGATVGSCTGGFGSGLIGGWVTAKHCLTGLANQPNVMFRFIMGSGTTCNGYDGIAIDDIYIYNGMPHTPNYSVVCSGTTFNFTAITPPCPTVSSYTWNFGDPLSGPANASSLANPSHVFSGPGTYSISLTTAGGGCNPPGTITQTLTVNSFTPAPLSQNITCFGMNNGSGTVSALGAGPFTYTWSPTGGNSATASNLSPGNYSVQIKDANNCLVTKTLSIIQPPVLTAPVTTSSILCFGGATGSATVTAGGGTPGYTYTWSPSGGNSATASNLTAGSYTVLVKDASNCTVTAVANISQPATSVTAPVASSSVLCNGGATGSATVTVAGGTPGYTYTWSPVGGNSTTASSLTVGSYTILVKDANNCTVTAVTNINQPTAIIAPVTSSSVLCNAGNTGSATVNVSGGSPGYTYTWSPTGGNSATASNLTAGNYTVLVNDANNCTVTAVTNITQPTAITAPVTTSNVLCSGGSTGSATVIPAGGTPGYTYTWSPSGGNSATASNFTAGSYTVLVKDANNCTVTAVANITQPAALTAPVASSSILCNGGATGSATVTAAGGTPGYTYTWSPMGGNSATASNLTAGSYTILVKDANNCTVTAVANIAQPAVLTAPVASSSVLCNGGTTGNATVTASGGAPGYSYTWSPSGGNSTTASNLSAGNYTVLVRDVNNCTITAVTSIIQPAVLVAPISSSSVLCNGGSTGSATVTPSGGTPGYSYTWSPLGGNSSIASNLTAGSYTVLVKDANNCTITAVANISQPAALTAPVSSSSVLCNGGSTGSATVSAAGGVPLYSYTWSPIGGNSSTANNLTAGSYTVLVKDVNNCTVTAVTTISQPPALTTTITSSNATCGMTNGSATVIAAGGNPGYTYSWSPSGGTSSIASGLGAGNYAVLVTDVNSCTITASTTVNQPVSMSVTINTGSVICNGGSSGSATVSVSGGTTPYSYTWSPAPGGGQGTANATGLTAQTYTVNISDNFGCSTVAIAAIAQPPVLTAPVSSSSVLCFGGATGSATVTASGGTPGYTYTWSPSGGNSSIANSLTVGSYTILVADANNCTLTAVANIAQPPVLTTMVNSNTVQCNGGSTGGATVAVSGGVGSYSYTWSPSGGNTFAATNLSAGSYTVLVTDANNCITAAVANISQPAAISATVNSTSASCGLSNGSATVNVSGGIPGYNYNWSPSGGNSSVATGLSAGAYTVLITDANNCTFSITTNINQPSVITTTISGTNATCFGGSNGTSTVLVNGGIGPYTYTWAPAPGGGQGTNIITGLTSQTYSVVVTDALGCFTTTAINITQPTVLNAVVSSTNVSCNGFINGLAFVTANGGTGAYSYTWSPSGGNASLTSGLAAGNYTVVVADANNCQITASATILEPSPITASITSSNITCNGFANGSATVTAAGGIPGYTYTWSPSGGNAIVANNLSALTYSVVIRDLNNCLNTATVNIIQPSPLTVIGTQTNVTCNGGTNGQASVTANGGTSPYSYSWSVTGITVPLTTSLTNGTYTCVITDINNCIITQTFSITQPAVLIASTSNYSICSGNSATLTSSAVGGVAPYSFNWNGGAFVGQTINPVPSSSTIFSLVVTDNNGCTSSPVSSSVTVFSQPTVSIAGNDSVCFGSSSIINAGVVGATGNITYLWTPGSFTTAAITVSPSSNTIYNVVVTTSGLCPLGITKQVTVTVLPNPVVSVNSPPSGCAPLCVTYTSNSSTTMGTIVGWGWNFTNGSSSTAQNPAICFESPGTFSGEHTVVNSFGCMTTINTGSIIVYPKPIADFNHAPIKPIVNIDQEVIFTDASWGTPIVSWNWYFMNTAQYTSTQQNPTFAYTEPGTYVVTLIVKSNQGCMDTLLRPLVVGEDYGLYVPNAFTPNEDGFNDVFQPKGFGIVKYELYIFDRWGEKLFHTKTFEEAWNGTYQGRSDKLCKDDVYVWLINATDVFGKAHELKGHVTLLK